MRFDDIELDYSDTYTCPPPTSSNSPPKMGNSEELGQQPEIEACVIHNQEEKIKIKDSYFEFDYLEEKTLLSDKIYY